MADPELQNQFHAACHNAGLLGGGDVWNHELMRLRKAGKLPKHDDPKSVTIGIRDFDSYRFAGEIAWRMVSDKHAHVSLDEIFCQLATAERFDKSAIRFCPGREAVELRWAALYLRKSRHALEAEAHDYHYVFATRDFDRFTKLTKRNAASYDGFAGVYLLLGAKKSPLYIGDTLDIGGRLATHLSAPGSRQKVTQFAVITDDDLPSRNYREALKVALAQRWQPEWNVC